MGDERDGRHSDGRRWDLVVVGASRDGCAAALAARRLGARVLLVANADRYAHSAVAAQTLLRSAEVVAQAAQAERYGLVMELGGRLNTDGVLSRVHAVKERLAERDALARLQALGVMVRRGLEGSAHFVAGDTLELDGERHTARAFLLCTGGRARVPSLPGLDKIPYLTADTLWDETVLPPSLVVLGAGATGLVLGQALRRLGTSMAIVERGERLLPHQDPECVAELRLRLESDGVAIHTDVTVESVQPTELGELGELGERGERGVRLLSTRSGARLDLDAAKLLVAVGRQPHTQDLGLAAAGVDFDDRRVAVDDELRTTNPRIFAIGEVAGRASPGDAELAVRNALLPLAARINDRAVPRAVFTQPELAWVGLTVAEARDQLRDVELFEARFDETDRALTDGLEPGLCRLVTASGRLVGAHLVGAQAGELIHVATLAVQERLPLSSLAEMSWLSPTLSEVISKASQRRKEALLERPWVRRGLRLLGRFSPPSAA